MTSKTRGSGSGKALWRWGLRGLLGLGGIGLLSIGAVWAKAELALNHRWSPAPTALSLAPAVDLVDEGERLFHVFGCHGCHGDSGRVLFEARGVGRLVAPNLSVRVSGYDDAALVRLIRRGVRADGTSLVGMPTGAFDEMADNDLAAVVAYLRRLPPHPDNGNTTGRWGPIGLMAIAIGSVPFSAGEVDDTWAGVERPSAEGGYLARTICTACHDLDQSRDDGFGLFTPALRDVVPAYEPQEFRHLIRTGRPPDGRDLGLMRTAAEEGLRHLTDPEIEAVRAYLSRDPQKAENAVQRR